MSNVLKFSDIFIDHNKKYVLEKTSPVPCQKDNEINTDHGNHNELLKSDINLMVDNARVAAANIIAEAKRQAEEVLTKSSDESDNIKEEAYNEGFRQGFDNGLKKAADECRILIEDILAEKEQIINEREKLYSVFEQDIVNLALEISKKVIYEKLAEDDEAFLMLVQSTITKVRGVDFVKIWVNPFDHIRLVEVRNQLISGIKGMKDIEFLIGESVKRWGLIIDTESGVLDGGVETRIAQIEKALISAKGS